MVKYNKEHYPNGLNHNFGAKVDVLYEKYGNITGDGKVIDPCMRYICARMQPSSTTYTAHIFVL